MKKSERRGGGGRKRKQAREGNKKRLFKFERMTAKEREIQRKKRAFAQNSFKK